MIRHGGGFPPAPLEDDDMLEEILFRLPPQPSSLPRASAVCKHWRGLLTNPRFLHRFYVHHRKPPLLGVFLHHDDKIYFTSVLPAPDRIPPGRLELPIRDLLWGRLLGCRHGLVLILHRLRSEVLVCDPITDNQHYVPVLPEFKWGYVYRAVLCAACDQGHLHGSCHSTPFKVVLLLTRANNGGALASIHSSESDTWGNLISTEAPCPDIRGCCLSTLVGNVPYWRFMYAKDGIFAFDMERQKLYVLGAEPYRYESSP